MRSLNVGQYDGLELYPSNHKLWESACDVASYYMLSEFAYNRFDLYVKSGRKVNSELRHRALLEKLLGSSNNIIAAPVIPSELLSLLSTQGLGYRVCSNHGVILKHDKYSFHEDSVRHLTIAYDKYDKRSGETVRDEFSVGMSCTVHNMDTNSDMMVVTVHIYHHHAHKQNNDWAIYHMYQTIRQAILVTGFERAYVVGTFNATKDKVLQYFQDTGFYVVDDVYPESQRTGKMDTDHGFIVSCREKSRNDISDGVSWLVNIGHDVKSHDFVRGTDTSAGASISGSSETDIDSYKESSEASADAVTDTNGPTHSSPFFRWSSPFNKAWVEVSDHKPRICTKLRLGTWNGMNDIDMRERAESNGMLHSDGFEAMRKERNLKHVAVLKTFLDIVVWCLQEVTRQFLQTVRQEIPLMGCIFVQKNYTMGLAGYVGGIGFLYNKELYSCEPNDIDVILQDPVCEGGNVETKVVGLTCYLSDNQTGKKTAYISVHFPPLKETERSKSHHMFRPLAEAVHKSKLVCENVVVCGDFNMGMRAVTDWMNKVGLIVVSSIFHGKVNKQRRYEIDHGFYVTTKGPLVGCQSILPSYSMPECEVADGDTNDIIKRGRLGENINLSWLYVILWRR